MLQRGPNTNEEMTTVSGSKYSMILAVVTTILIFSDVNGIVVLTPSPGPDVTTTSECNRSAILKHIPPISLAPTSIKYTGKFPRKWIKRPLEVITTLPPSPEPEVEAPTESYYTTPAPDSPTGVPASTSTTVSLGAGLPVPSRQPVSEDILTSTPTKPSAPLITPETPHLSFVTEPNTFTSTLWPPLLTLIFTNKITLTSTMSTLSENTTSEPFSTHTPNLDDSFVLTNKITVPSSKTILSPNANSPKLLTTHSPNSEYPSTPKKSETSAQVNSSQEHLLGDSSPTDTQTDLNSNFVHSIKDDANFIFTTGNPSITPTTDSSLYSTQLPTKTPNPQDNSSKLSTSLNSTDQPKLINIEKSPPMDPTSLEKELSMVLASRLPLALDEDLLYLWGAPYLQRLQYVNHEMVDDLLQAEIRPPPESSECPLEYQELSRLGLQRILGLLLLTLPQSLKEVEEAMWDHDLDAYFFRPQEKSILDVTSCRDCYIKDLKGVCRQMLFCKNGVRPKSGPRLSPADLRELKRRRSG